MKVVKLATQRTRRFPEDIQSHLERIGLPDWVNGTYLIFGDSEPRSYYDIKHSEQYCGCDARDLIVLGIKDYLYYQFVHVEGDDPEKYRERENYFCLDVETRNLVIARPFHGDLWFVNSSLSHFVACNDSFGRLYDELHDELDVLDRADDKREEARAFMDLTIPSRLRAEFARIAPDAVGQRRAYERETYKFWEDAIDDFFHD